MTRKDYQIVARALAAQRWHLYDDKALNTVFGIRRALLILDMTVETVAAHFALTNNRFDVDKFKEACAYGHRRNA